MQVDRQQATTRGPILSDWKMGFYHSFVILWLLFIVYNVVTSDSTHEILAKIDRNSDLGQLLSSIESNATLCSLFLRSLQCFGCIHAV